MFRKKEQPVQAQSHILNGRYVKVEPNRRGGYVEYKRDLAYMHPSNQASSWQQGISEIDISESYLSERDEQEMSKKRQDVDKLNKSNRRKIPFLQKKKKETGQNFASEHRITGGSNIDEDNEEENDDISDITTYNEGIPIAYERKNGLNPTGLNQAIKRLDLDHQYAEEVQIYERMNYIMENYRPPPAYPGNANADSPGKSMIQQLLQEKANKQMKDNASMINYCQVDAPKDLSTENLSKIIRASPAEQSVMSSQLRSAMNGNGKSPVAYQSPVSAGAVAASTRPDIGNNLKDDKLVMRTLRSPRSPESLRQSLFNFGSLKAKPINAGDVFDIRNTRPDPELISEIYPRDYDPDYDNDEEVVDPKEAPQGSRKISIESSSGNEVNKPYSGDETFRSNQNYIVDVMPSYRGNEVEEETFAKPYAKPPSYHQHPERDYDLPEGSDYEPEVYDTDVNIARGQMPSIEHLTYSHSHEKSETYVPPSPYMNAEIPEWLQVYAKASPELDTILKWDMFRLPELDCWQTMLKRLYMKELEQIVFWFEEYRQSMQQEIERRERELGIMRVSMPVVDQRMKKTDV